MYNNSSVWCCVYNKDYGAARLAIAIYYGIVRHRISDFIEEKRREILY